MWAKADRSWESGHGGALWGRELLSAVDLTFAFIREWAGSVVEPLLEVRGELWWMSRAVPFMEAQLRLPLANLVRASDAQGAGEHRGKEAGDAGGLCGTRLPCPHQRGGD